MRDTNTVLRSLILVPLSILLQQPTSYAFLPSSNHHLQQPHLHQKQSIVPNTLTRRLPPLPLFDDDFPNNDITREEEEEEEDSQNAAWQTALRKRQQSIANQKHKTRQRWLDADFQQSLLGIPDWVRRVSVRWPIAVCGSCSGDIYVVHCESGKVLGKGEAMEDQRRYADAPLSNELSTTLKMLFGDFDGGGTLSIGISWTYVVASAGRDGGVWFWKLGADAFLDNGEKDDNGINTMVPQGTLLDGVLITCLEWAEDDLWIGTQDGRVLVYTIHDEDDDNGLSLERIDEWSLEGTVLSLSYHEELDVAVVTTSSGSVEILSMDEPDSVPSFDPPFQNSDALPLCATIVEEHSAVPLEDEEEDDDDKNGTPSSSLHQKKRTFALACGGNDGIVSIRSLRLLDDTIDPELDMEHTFDDPVVWGLEPHRGPCKCLVSPFPGILLSGGQDGTVRVWEFCDTDVVESSPKYVLSGFKVWLGSLWTDGDRLVMDGADNAISLLNFGEEMV